MGTYNIVYKVSMDSYDPVGTVTSSEFQIELIDDSLAHDIEIIDGSLNAIFERVVASFEANGVI